MSHGGVHAVEATVYLMQGSTVIASEVFEIGESPYNCVMDLSIAEATAISDYNDLRIRVVLSPEAGANGAFRVHEMSLTMPDPAASSPVTVQVPLLNTNVVLRDKNNHQGAWYQDREYEVIAFGIPALTSPETVAYAEARDEADARAGGVCSISGYWFPGHLLVQGHEGPVGRPFYRDPGPDGSEDQTDVLGTLK